ncbi:YbfB/YjiJ family MFS transporter [Silvimonas iriomotensis]|uniref:MFS transporter n=1 Tax=Silvimonas iriomotensis TaxID=449662 RepID=A0ABQ2P6Y0_9NEIS|nr:YbfB/YjiJ family MFS transporter [Silvimonas iriomotensis]GGP19393.1 MFS transporter [Silvimonas iriomotensis]
MTTQIASHAPVTTAKSTMWLHVFAGLCASLVSIGLARFAYTPLLPPLIQAHWFAAADVVYLGAANLAGYLVGALVGRPIAARLSNTWTLRLMMALVTLAFFACAWPVSVGWFFFWRLMSGVAGGAIMVLVAGTVLPHVPPSRRGLASGAVFLGLGLGVAGSGTVVPLLLGFGLHATWLGLGAIALVLTVASWWGWPAPEFQTGAKAHEAGIRLGAQVRQQVTTVYAEYGLMALGLVPTMVFLVDFIARGLGAGAHTGALFWILYGVGAIFGPPAYGLMADALGSRLALRLVLLVQAFVVGLLAWSSNLVIIGVLTLLIGSFPPGIVPLVLARVHHIVPHNAHQQNVIWSRATTVFAAAQALAGYAYGSLFNHSNGDHRLLFVIGTASLAIALAVDLFSRATTTAPVVE